MPRVRRPSLDQNVQRSTRPARPRRGAPLVDASYLEDLVEDKGKTLHMKDGQVYLFT